MREVIDLVAEHTGVSPDRIGASTRVGEDLGVDGDDERGQSLKFEFRAGLGHAKREGDSLSCKIQGLTPSTDPIHSRTDPIHDPIQVSARREATCEAPGEHEKDYPGRLTPIYEAF